MTHIKTQREILRQITRKYCDDVYDFFHLAQSLEAEFIDKQEEELTKYMNSKSYHSKEDLENEYIFWVEKNRGKPLDMGEMNDIYEAIENWAKDNGYGYLYEEEPHSYEDELFSYLNHLQFDTYDELCSTIRCWFRDEKHMEIKDDECMEFASDFVDKKELGDISYDDLVLYFKQ